MFLHRPHLSEVDAPVFLLDPDTEDTAIVASSAGFRRQTGYSESDLIGSPFDMLFEHVPSLRLSSSALADVKSFLKKCILPDLRDIGDLTIVQPMNRHDGSVFLGHLTLVRCANLFFQKPYVAGVQVVLSESIAARVVQTSVLDIKEQSRRFVDICLQASLSKLIRALPWTPRTNGALPDFAIYSARLPDHAMILHSRNTHVVARRDPVLYDRGCMVFSDRPLRFSRLGLQFSVRVESRTKTFRSWPYLGYTKRRPVISADLYPQYAKCCGASVTIGGDGHAFARDQQEHLRLGFRRPHAEQLTELTSQPALPAHERHVPLELMLGDVLHCRYTWKGRLELWVNDLLILSFDMARPLIETTDYFAVIDVGSSVTRVSLVPSEVCAEEWRNQFASCAQCEEHTSAPGMKLPCS